MKTIKSKLLLTAMAILSFSPTYASIHKMMPGVTMEFNLAPNKKEEFTNFSFSKLPLLATCLINTSDAEGNDIFIEILRKNGKINDLVVSQGDNVVFHVRDKEILKITAESGGKVALTNLGPNTVKAICSA